MAWTAPRTWVAGELVTAALMNIHVRDNLLALEGGLGGTAWPMGGEENFQQTDSPHAEIKSSGRISIDGTNVNQAVLQFMAKVDAGTGEVRLYNVTDTAAVGSAVSVTATSLTRHSSGALTLASGTKEYRVEAQRGTTWIAVWGCFLVTS